MEPACPQKSPYVTELGAGTYAWCRCGRSGDQPYCDGSHRGTGIAPEIVEIESKRTVAWCGCKRTKKPPFCDGTHSLLG